MDTLFVSELVLSIGSIAWLAWKIAGHPTFEPTPAVARPATVPPAPVALTAGVAASDPALSVAAAPEGVGPTAVAAQGPGKPGELRPPDFQRLRWGLSSEQVPMRLAAAAELSLIPGAEALELLAGLVRDPDFEVRRIAVQRLGAEKSPAHLDALLAAARDVRIEVQNAACEGLIGSPDERVVDLFRRLALNGLHYARLLGIRGLGAARGQEKLLLEIYRNSIGKVREEAVVALAASSEPEALDAVREHLRLRLEQGPIVAPPEPVDESQFRQVMEQEPSVILIEELETAVKELAPSKRKGEVLGRLAAIASEATVEERRRFLAVRGIGFLGGLPALEQLETFTQDAKTAVRFGAVIAIGKLRSAKVIETLKRALGDSSFLVRGAAVVFLEQLGQAVERPIFEAAALDTDPLVKELARKVLAGRPAAPSPFATRVELAPPRPPTAAAPEPKAEAKPERLPPPPSLAGITLTAPKATRAGIGRSDQALESLLRPLRNPSIVRPLTRFPGDHRKLTLSEVLRRA